MSTEAQKRASKKYYMAHKDYYRKKTKESIKRTRMERHMYKERCKQAIEYIERNKEKQLDDLLNILQNGSDEE